MLLLHRLNCSCLAEAIIWGRAGANTLNAFEAGCLALSSFLFSVLSFMYSSCIIVWILPILPASSFSRLSVLFSCRHPSLYFALSVNSSLSFLLSFILCWPLLFQEARVCVWWLKWTQVEKQASLDVNLDLPVWTHALYSRKDLR